MAIVVVDQLINHLGKRQETLVDVRTLDKACTRGPRLTGAFRTSQIDQVQVANLSLFRNRVDGLDCLKRFKQDTLFSF